MTFLGAEIVANSMVQIPHLATEVYSTSDLLQAALLLHASKEHRCRYEYLLYVTLSLSNGQAVNIHHGKDLELQARYEASRPIGYASGSSR